MRPAIRGGKNDFLQSMQCFQDWRDSGFPTLVAEAHKAVGFTDMAEPVPLQQSLNTVNKLDEIKIKQSLFA